MKNKKKKQHNKKSKKHNSVKLLSYINGLFPFLFSKSGCVFIFAVFFWFFGYYSIKNDYLNRSVLSAKNCLSDFAKDIGLEVKEISIHGNSRLNKKQILRKIGIKNGDGIFIVDLNEIKKKLDELAWIKDVVIKRSLSGKIDLYLTEKEAIAIYHDAKSNNFYLVDKEGNLIDASIPCFFKSLPTLSGGEANKFAPSILEKIGKYEEIRSRLTAMAFIQKRRWNLKLNNQIEIKLPEDGVEEALEALNKIVEQGKATSGDVLGLDFRIAGKVIFKLSKSGLEYLKMTKGKEKVKL